MITLPSISKRGRSYLAICACLCSLIIVAAVGITSARSAAAATLCVIDDSIDMSGTSGLVAREDRGQMIWPALTYVIPAIGCQKCCYWSDWLKNPSSCDSRCNVQRVAVPNLTETSPLTQGVAAASRIGSGQDTYFITNGLDWQILGRDSQFRTELDAGASLSEWLGRKAEHAVVLGVLRDRQRGPNSTASARSNVILGFLASSPQGAVCDSSLPNVPPVVSVQLRQYVRPSNQTIKSDAVRLVPAIELSDDRGQRRQLAIQNDGRVLIPKSIAESFPNGGVLTVHIGLDDAQPFCWGIGALVDDRPTAGQCQRTGTSLSCRYRFPGLRQVGSSFSFGLTSEPEVPAWQNISADHSLSRTGNTMQALQRRRLQLSFSDRQRPPQRQLTVIVVPNGGR